MNKISILTLLVFLHHTFSITHARSDQGSWVGPALFASSVFIWKNLPEKAPIINVKNPKLETPLKEPDFFKKNNGFKEYPYSPQNKSTILIKNGKKQKKRSSIKKPVHVLCMNNNQVTIPDDYEIIDQSQMQEDTIDTKYKTIKNNLETSINKEYSFENKALLLANTYTNVQRHLENDYPDDIDTQLDKLIEFRNSIKPIEQELISFQYNYEWIIGRTRTTDNPYWTKQEKDHFYQAKALFNTIKNTKEITNLNGLENLEKSIQQALLCAIEQQLKDETLSMMVKNYIKKHNKA